MGLSLPTSPMVGIRETENSGLRSGFRPTLIQSKRKSKPVIKNKFKVKTMMMIEMECETEDISGNLDRFLEGLHFTGSDEIKKLDSVIYPISIDKVENQSMGA